MNEEILNVQDLCNRWKWHKNSVYNAVNSGLLPCFRLPGGRHLRFRLEDIKNYELKQSNTRKEIFDTRRKAVSAPRKEWKV